jgi:hypothetical protein
MAGFNARKTSYFRIPNARNSPSDDARQSAFAKAAVVQLQPLLPRIARENVVGGPSSALQLSEADRRRQIRLALLANPGTHGSTLLDASKTLLFIFINGYARARGWTETDTWPISAAVAASLVEGEHERATTAKRGSQSGGIVGHKMRTSLKSLNDHFGCPIDLSGPLVTRAAPASLPGAPSPAEKLPVHVYCQLETIANRDAQPSVEGEADVARFFARSLLLVKKNQMLDTLAGEC